VAYLDDGTMVVVDNARRMINKTVDISVTSVHQTTAGKMIFGRYDDRGEHQAPRSHVPADSPAAGHPSEAAGGERSPRPLYPDPGRS
jgi:hypothetical protein